MTRERTEVTIDVYHDPEDGDDYRAMHARALRELKRRYSFYDADDVGEPDKDGDVWCFTFVIYGQYWEDEAAR